MISEDGGNLSFVNAPDYENPIDANSDNTYQITITGTDNSGITQSDSSSIKIVDVDEESNEESHNHQWDHTHGNDDNATPVTH